MLLTLTIAPLRPRSIAQCANARPQLSGPATLTAKKRAASAGLRFDQRQNGKMSGVVDENVDRAEAIDRRGDHPLAVSWAWRRHFDDQNRRPHASSIVAADCMRVALVRPARATEAPWRARAARSRSRSPSRRRSRSRPCRQTRAPRAVPSLAWTCHTPTRSQAIDWNRRAKALIGFAVSMSRSVIFIPASWVQNENDTTL